MESSRGARVDAALTLEYAQRGVLALQGDKNLLHAQSKLIRDAFSERAK